MQNSTAEVISAERSSLPGSNAAGQNTNNTAARLHNLKKHGATEGTLLSGSVTGTGVISVKNSRDHAEVAVICNISDQSWLLHRTHGTFAIAACEPGQDYALTPISSRRGRIDLGDKRTLDFPITAREIADDWRERLILTAARAAISACSFVMEACLPTKSNLRRKTDLFRFTGGWCLQRTSSGNARTTSC